MASIVRVAPPAVRPSRGTSPSLSNSRFMAASSSSSTFWRRFSGLSASSILTFSFLPSNYDAVVHLRFNRLASFRCFSGKSPSPERVLELVDRAKSNGLQFSISCLLSDRRSAVWLHYGSLICAALTPELKRTIDKVVTSNKVVLFMKGTKDFPQCGFSNTVVQILKSLNVPFKIINILENEVLCQAMKEYSSWPTFPQLYIDGEFFGGCDITVGFVVVFGVGEGWKPGRIKAWSRVLESSKL
ncbi:hypothetical protein Cgig2_027967 [Carnegiea gigantea]|uniref:Glutaredoxin domain-containing protein n=1 Tax=Carnegiea gigantea TaxID=171969 RepID=A0A9Q1JLE2_9CARY|nr:hypothetical protein Cgig2_027967 [Carnegiea gigantea]